VEQQLSANASLGVSYIGSHAYHELLSVDANLPTPTICRQLPALQAIRPVRIIIRRARRGQ